MMASDGIIFLMDEPIQAIASQFAPRSFPATPAALAAGGCPLLAALVAASCERDTCGPCHGAMCVAGQAAQCHAAPAPGGTFLDATWGSFAVCRQPCPDLESGLASLVGAGSLPPREAVEILKAHLSEAGRRQDPPRAFYGAEDLALLCDFSDPCTDAPTPDGHSCQDQLLWGKCATSWMREGSFCQRTCGTCFTSCVSLPVGAQCSTEALGDRVPAPCGPGLACAVFDGGDPARDVPPSGICVAVLE